MSYKYHAQKVGEAHYVLPKTGLMKCDVHAFLSESLYAASEENVWEQAVTSAAQPGAIGMYLMPDTHVGYSIPVGGVLVTEDVIVQAGSGYDISCGVIYLRVPKLTAADVADWDKRVKWVNAVEERIATGYSNHGNSLMKRLRKDQIDDILRYGAKAIGVKSDLCERQFIQIPEDIDVRTIEAAYDKAAPQMGSVGGGNHFVEMQVDRDDGSVWLMVHCGSRGFGWKTADYFFRKGAALRGLRMERREESWLRADEPLGREYWAHHNAAANYAIANRWHIVNGLREATEEVFKAELVPYYEISHNLVQEETLLLPDGTTKRGFVHRKGATRAFPAGHPDLKGSKWEVTGHPCLIPGSMYAGAAILFPLDGARATACSVNHGSGRVLGRNDAKKTLASLQADIDAQMRDVKRTLGGVEITGIVGNCPNTPLDECGMVYKDLDEVLKVLEVEGIARMERRLFPVCNLKGADNAKGVKE